MKTTIMACAILAALTGTAHALEVPKSSTYDARVRSITYNPADVVQIDTMIGISTLITVEQGERYVSHDFGDPEAWEFKNIGENYFIRPKANDSDTNLTIITNRRRYKFWLSYAPTRKGSAMFAISFVYPEVIAKRAEAEARKATLAQRLAERRGDFNWKYSMSGDLDIAPTEGWDNGEFTYFRIPGNRDVPGFFMVDDDGHESIVNRNTIGASNDLVVLHKVNAKWIVRLGTRALAIWNDAYKPDGVKNETGTASPSVTRMVKGVE